VLTAGNHRIAIVSTALFFVLGLMLLSPINVARGAQAARSAV
jgi:MFS transporter, UMF1 family